MVQAFEFANGTWTELANKEVVPNMPNCTGALLRPGYASAFVMYQPTQMLYALDLEHVEEGEIEIMTSTLSFTPFDGTVAGVPSEVACTIEHHHDHDISAASSLFLSVMSGLLISAVGYATM